MNRIIKKRFYRLFIATQVFLLVFSCLMVSNLCAMEQGKGKDIKAIKKKRRISFFGKNKTKQKISEYKSNFSDAEEIQQEQPKDEYMGSLPPVRKVEKTQPKPSLRDRLQARIDSNKYSKDNINYKKVTLENNTDFSLQIKANFLKPKRLKDNSLPFIYRIDTGKTKSIKIDQQDAPLMTQVSMYKESFKVNNKFYSQDLFNKFLINWEGYYIVSREGYNKKYENVTPAVFDISFNKAKVVQRKSKANDKVIQDQYGSFDDLGRQQKEFNAKKEESRYRVTQSEYVSFDDIDSEKEKFYAKKEESQDHKDEIITIKFYKDAGVNVRCLVKKNIQSKKVEIKSDINFFSIKIKGNNVDNANTTIGFKLISGIEVNVSKDHKIYKFKNDMVYKVSKDEDGQIIIKAPLILEQ